VLTDSGGSPRVWESGGLAAVLALMERGDQLERHLTGTPWMPSPAPRNEQRHVLMLTDLERAERIGG